MRDFTPSFAGRLAQVVLDRARTDEQLSGDLSVRVSVRHEARDLCLLRRQLAEQNDEWQVARRYMSADSITKALADRVDEPEEVIPIAAAA